MGNKIYKRINFYTNIQGTVPPAQHKAALQLPEPAWEGNRQSRSGPVWFTNSDGQNVLPPPAPAAGKEEKIALRGAGKTDSEGFVCLCLPGLKLRGGIQGDRLPRLGTSGREDKNSHSEKKINLKWDLKAGTSTFEIAFSLHFSRSRINCYCEWFLQHLCTNPVCCLQFNPDGFWVCLVTPATLIEKAMRQQHAELGDPNPFIWIDLVYWIYLT